MKQQKPIVVFAVLLLITSLFSCSSQAQGHTDLTVAEFEKAIQQKNIQVLDVRTSGEYQSGHISHAFLADWNNAQQFQERVSALDKSKPVYTYCLGGGRSTAATAWLNAHGYTAYNLSGGMNAWRKENKPVEGVEDVPQLSFESYKTMIPADKIVLVDFGAVWCPPCKKMEPVLDSLVKENPSAFVFVKIDGGAQSQLCKLMQVDGFPTFIIYKKGEPVWRHQGLVDKEELRKQLSGQR